MFLSVLLCICLGFIAYEDIRFREVRTYWFIALLVLLVFEQFTQSAMEEVLWRYVGNVGFLAVQFALLQLYFIIKERRLLWIFDRYIGWGDVVFLICIAGVWTLVGFLLFSIISLLFSLLIYMLFLRRGSETIPLAGLQAICFFVARFGEEVGVF